MGGQFNTYYDGDPLIGMFISLKMKKYNYAVYTAVDEKLRGKGYGQKIVNRFIRKI